MPVSGAGEQHSPPSGHRSSTAIGMVGASSLLDPLIGTGETGGFSTRMTKSASAPEDRVIDERAASAASVDGAGRVAPSTRLRSRLIEVHDPAWLSFLKGTVHDFYHLPGYVRLEARHEHARPCALLVEDGPSAMLLPLLIRTVPDAGWDATSPYGCSGPLLRGTQDPDFIGDALAAGAEMLRSVGVISLFVRMHPLLSQALPRGIGTVVRHCDTVAVDLRQPSDVLLRQMRRNHRVQIRQAREVGYAARWDVSDAGYAIFKKLYQESMKRLGASEFYCLDDRYLDELRGALGERLRLALIDADGEVYAAGLFSESCGMVEAHLTGSEAGSGRTCPKAAKLLFGFAIEESRASGHRWLHLGGGRHAEEDGLFHFKAGFSPLRFPFHTLRIVTNRAKYERLAAAQDADGDPADLTGYFPAYRRLSPAHSHGW